MKFTKIILATLLFSGAIFANEANDTMALKKEGVKYIKMLGMALKSELKKHLQADKTALDALHFCVDKAAKITAEVNSKLPEGVLVRRTALKFRNPANKPDEIDTKVMNEMLEAKKAGKFKAKPVVVDAGDKIRVYKPLIIDDVCLKCHGDPAKMDKKVQEIVSKKYPEDKATGFKLYDLRGVIVAELPKKENSKK